MSTSLFDHTSRPAGVKLSADGSGAAAAVRSAPARRAASPTWRDPRLIVGVLLVCGSVYAGVRIVSAADDTVEVWVATDDLAADTVIDPDDLEINRVRFESDDDADRYLPGSSDAPRGARLDRPVGEGEMVPRSAIDTDATGPLVQVPVPVAGQSAPADLAAGDVVDVWVVPSGFPAAAPQPSAAPLRAALVLERAVVIAAEEQSSTLGSVGTRQILLGLDAQATDALDQVLGDLADGSVTLLRHER